MGSSLVSGRLSIVSNEGNPLAVPVVPAKDAHKCASGNPCSGQTNGKPPGAPKRKEETGKKHREAHGLGPLLDGSPDNIGDRFAGHDKTDIKRDQFHGVDAPDDAPCSSRNGAQASGHGYAFKGKETRHRKWYRPAARLNTKARPCRINPCASPDWRLRPLRSCLCCCGVPALSARAMDCRISSH